MPVAFDVGDTVTLIGTFENEDGEPADPVDLAVTIRKPDGTVDDITADAVELGVWEAEYPLDQEGTWWYRFQDPGDVNTPAFAEESSFVVRRRRVPEGS